MNTLPSAAPARQCPARPAAGWKTYGWKRFRVNKNERALLLRNGDFDRVLPPGLHRVAAWGDSLHIERSPQTQAALQHPLADYLMAHEPEVVARHFVRADVGEAQVGLLMEDGLLTEVLPPGTRRLYWRELRAIDVQVLPLPADTRIAPELTARLQQLQARCGHAACQGVLLEQVPQFHTGLLRVDGQVQQVLPPGVYGFWTFAHTVRVDVVDLRAQTAEVAGQDILTRDKVGLRLNLSAVWRYTDVPAAFSQLPKPAEHVYRELQFALRAAVGQRTLDALLDDKAAIDTVVLAQVQAKLRGCGLHLESVGVKDIILPGEMRSILAQVVEAEKAAQANVIRRREETAATRSLLNTAKVMEDNPVALRMKELETLERVAERIDKISVVGGLDQVLNGLVKLR
ncbi:MAG: slipin family protein [Pseudomonadota bacterium]|nr:slipin family protein [Pseudomonadota bacterium]